MFSLFEVNINDLNLREALDKIHSLLKAGGKHLVVTANPEIMVRAACDPEYKKVLQSASLILADGIGIVMASYILGQPLKKGKLAGVDLIEGLIKRSVVDRFSIFIAGSTVDVLNKTTHNLRLKYGNINIVGQYSAIKTNKDFLFYNKNKEEQELISQIQFTKPDILLLAFGYPRQEIWLNKHLDNLPVKIGIGVGGSFDYLSGAIKRAPEIFRRLGFEWLWRLLIEPWRIKRIFKAVLVFPYLVMVEAFKKYVLCRTEKK